MWRASLGMNTTPYQPLMPVSSEDFPVAAAPDEKLLFLLNYAILAPSSHNTQPWLFRLQGHELDLIADLNRSLPICDPENRELIMSGGAALHHLRVAARYFGHDSRVDIFPESESPYLLARFSLGGAMEATAEDMLLFNAIPRRHTNRGAFLPDPVPQALLDVLSQMTERYGCWVQFFQDDESRFQIADLVSEADCVQWADKLFRRELANWLTPNRSPRRDGIPGYAHGKGDLISDAEPFLVRTFDLGKGQAARDREIALHSPVLAVLGSAGDTKADWLNAGQALSAILLRSRVEDVWASFLSQVVEVPSTRAQLESLAGAKGAPQILLRLGFGREAKPTPRRALPEFILRPKNRPIRLTAENLS
jgi:hypothetical protein